MKVSKWGNSLALRLPRAVVEALELKDGDSVDVHIVGKRSLEIEKKKSRKELIESLRELRGSIPADFKFNREELYDRKR